MASRFPTAPTEWVRSPAGTVTYDPTGKAAGRGAYLCGQPECLDMAVRRRSIQRALKVTDTVAASAARSRP